LIEANGSEFWHQNGKELSKQEIEILKDSLEFDEMIREMCSGE